MTQTQRPNKPCYACGSNKWWQRPDGGWTCGWCHPNPNPAPAPSKEQYAPVVLALRDRVFLGNDKLLRAWSELQGIKDKEERDSQFQRWGEAGRKLGELCVALIDDGYRECLRQPDTPKSALDCLGRDVCLVCPVDWETVGAKRSEEK